MPNCPHCGHYAKIISSRKQTTEVSDVYYWCRNAKCGCRFVVQAHITHITRQSRDPNPGIRIPVKPYGIPVEQKSG